MKLKNKINAIKDGQINFTIILTHNRNELLKALKSIQDQTHQNFEVIVQTMLVIYQQKFVEQLNDNRFTYIHNNQHQAHLFQKFGYKNGKGKYIAFLDDDDALMPNKLEEVNKHIVQNSDFLSSSYHKYG